MHKMLASYDGEDASVQDALMEGYRRALPEAANEGVALLYAAGCYPMARLELDVGEEPIVYDLSEQAADFHRLLPSEVRLADGSVTSRYRLAAETLFYPAPGLRGKVQVGYIPRPSAFTYGTPEDETVPLPYDAAVLLPLYVASQLYKEEDAAGAVQMRNEFEEGLSRLTKMKNAPLEGAPFQSESGWY